MRLRLLESLSEVDPTAWDALAGEDDPFAEHAFLHTLERSGSVGPGTGWEPRHVTLWEGERLVAAMPLYLKDHSYGEYIFDWAWADAAMRLGASYYPKLVSMTPVTPATGRRLLWADDVSPERAVAALVDGALAAAEQERASSLHLNFVSAAERDLLRRHPALLHRLTFQFHWHNRGYRSFDDFLGDFRSSLRKQTRKERRTVAESGLDIRVLAGDEVTPEVLAEVRAFYHDTCRRKGSFPYLTPEFFDLSAGTLRHRMVVVAAHAGGEMVAATLNFEKGAHLYGRYWGCREDFDMLHFELCYYRLIERAIERGARRFEAGAQGSHKLRRGLVPTAIHSAHWVRHPILREAIADFLPREAASVERQMRDLAAHGPFRREG